MFLLRPLRYLVKAFTDEASPKQLAYGFAIGMVIGLVPKGNLIAIGLMVVLGASRVNLGAGTLSAFIFSWIAMLLDPVSHWIGLSILSWNELATTWTWLYNQPIVPWTSFNNTIVLGSLVLGLAFVFPLAKLSELFFARYAPPMQKRLQRYRVVKLLLGMELASGLAEGTA